MSIPTKVYCYQHNITYCSNTYIMEVSVSCDEKAYAGFSHTYTSTSKCFSGIYAPVSVIHYTMATLVKPLLSFK